MKLMYVFESSQMVNSICELVELYTNAIMFGRRPIFACLKAVKIKQQRRSIELRAHRDVKHDEHETENLNVISQASTDWLQLG